MVKVLVADDEQDIRGLLTEMLSDAGYEVIQAENGRIALDKARQESPDVILMDVLMPVMDGLQALRCLRDSSDTARIPVVIMTAFAAMDNDPTKGIDLVTRLPKPWTIGALEGAITQALES